MRGHVVSDQSRVHNRPASEIKTILVYRVPMSDL